MSASIGSRASIQARQVELLQARHLVLDDACNDEAQAEPWPDTQTLVPIDTWTLPTPQTLVSIDTSQTRSDTAPTRSDTPNWRFRQLRRVRRVYRVSIVSNSDTLTLLTRPTRLATHVSPHKSPRMPTAKLGMQPMGLLGGSNPWPWPFGTTTPSTSAVGRHPDTSDTSDTQTLDTQTRSDTTHASHLSRALRHRLDTAGQTPLTLLTPVSIDTAQTRLRHCSDTPDTSDTQTQQGSRARLAVFNFKPSDRIHW